MPSPDFSRGVYLLRATACIYRIRLIHIKNPAGGRACFFILMRRLEDMAVDTGSCPNTGGDGLRRFEIHFFSFNLDNFTRVP